MASFPARAIDLFHDQDHALRLRLVWGRQLNSRYLDPDRFSTAVDAIQHH
jgi:hypothetical protein